MGIWPWCQAVLSKSKVVANRSVCTTGLRCRCRQLTSAAVILQDLGVKSVVR